MQTFDYLSACDDQRYAAIERAIADFAEANSTSEQEKEKLKKAADARVLGRFATSTLARWGVRVSARFKRQTITQEFDVWQQGRYPVAIDDAA